MSANEYGGNRKLAAETAFKEFHHRMIPTDSKVLQPAINDDELIQAKKLVNPVLQSKSHRSMQQEMKVNNKLGINVLNQKSELSRVFQDRNREKNFREQKPSSPPKSEFEQIISKRREMEEKKVEEENRIESLPEFLKVKNRLGSNKQ